MVGGDVQTADVNPITAQVWQALETVTDPEIPVLTIVDLGVARAVRLDGPEVVVSITPTYTGCPAMDTIEADIVAALDAHGFKRVRIVTVLSPAWTTDWMSADGRRKLEEYGISPPGEIRCPQCRSTETECLSEFGSTACKALYRCTVCREPFDHFKCI